MRRSTGLMAALILGTVVALTVGPLAQSKADVALRAAIETETVKGDLKAAIEQYKAIATGSDRAAAAKALVRMGQCYDKLGAAQAKEAQEAYERVIAQFADQSEAVAEARKHLAAGASSPDTTFAAKPVFAIADPRFYGQAISRDGRYIAYTMPYGYGPGPTIVVQDLVDRVERKIGILGPYAETNSNRWQTPDGNAMISPDGTQVAYFSRTVTEGERLHVINVDGSAPRVLVSQRTGNVSLCGWSPDGRRILATSSSGGPSEGQLIAISVADGVSAVIVPAGVLDAKYSPDGRYIAIEKENSPPVANGIYVVTAAGDREVLLVQDDNAWNPMWTADGKRVLFSRRRQESLVELWSIGVVDGKPEGIPELVKKDVPPLLGVTQTGDYYYASQLHTTDLYVVDIDPEAGKITSRPRQLTSRGWNNGATWSPDGAALAYVSDRSTKRVLVVRSAASGQERLIAPTGLPDYWNVVQPAWFPNGKSLLLGINGKAFYQTDLETGASRLLMESRATPEGNNHGHIRLAPDGRTVYYTSRGETLSTSIIRQSLDGGPGVEVCRVARTIGGPSLSPDGATLAFSTTFDYGTEKERWVIMTVPAAGGEPKEVFAAKFVMMDPVWSKDGRWLFFAVNNDPPVPGRRNDIWRVSTKGTGATPLDIGLHVAAYLDISPDGRRLVFGDWNHTSELWVMRNLFPAPKKSK